MQLRYISKFTKCEVLPYFYSKLAHMLIVRKQYEGAAKVCSSFWSLGVTDVRMCAMHSYALNQLGFNKAALDMLRKYVCSFRDDNRLLRFYAELCNKI